ncbi:hypothetical protein SB778_46925, partial [Paraburkholderia sp. SIMBA_050]
EERFRPFSLSEVSNAAPRKRGRIFFVAKFRARLLYRVPGLPPTVGITEIAMVSIRLPDGSVRQYEHPVTVAEVAAS